MASSCRKSGDFSFDESQIHASDASRLSTAVHAWYVRRLLFVNDYGADQAFARQVRAHGREGDAAVFISTSGQSRNLLRAAEEAERSGLHTLALTGRGPNPLVPELLGVARVPAVRG